jgi:signal transduction histidine kinase
MFAVALVLALLVAGISFSRISRLERRSEEERRRGEQAEHEMRRLSQKLVQAQEQERKSISRELHDEVGQMITALRMELTNLELLRFDSGTGFSDHLAEAKDLAEKTLQSVRNLAMGLRPSMLDDLGLGPALQWQAKEFSRRSGIPVAVDADGDLENLPEDLRTCIYRVVQESFTNCARHAQANGIHLKVRGTEGHVAMTIEDNGVGFDPGISRGQGLGLIGMEERVRELGGNISINSQPQKGTVIQLDVPLKREQPA